MSGDEPSTAREHHTRDETRERILDAALALIRNAGTSSVSLRQIAEAAGVTHPLIIRYFGSKQGLIAECLRRLDAPAPRPRMSLPPYQMLLSGMKASLQDRANRLSYARMALCAAPNTDPGFDPVPGRDLLERLQTVRQRTISLDAAESFDPRIVAAAISALSLGWMVSEEWLQKTFALGDIDEAVLVEQLARLSACLGELALPGPSGGGAPSDPADSRALSHPADD